ncbi:lysophospholipid acyltransferase family protein [Magnetovibrio sp. PR-2]|uniref:lysophospholipid acyltransferase family protein n=1 Tax=Magnetovibrio sp. PR-2 TaxID=3120356 RepID=UPI002FCDEC7C
MKLYKRIFEKPWAQSAISALAAGYMRFVRLTSKWEHRGLENVEGLVENETPMLISFWHGRLIPSLFGWPYASTLHILSTPHRDGQIAAKAYNRFGIKTIWGSTKKGGTEAVRNIIKVLKSGGVVALTPDGPKGPRQRMQQSSVDIARMTGAKLVPFGISATKLKWRNSWDCMVIPKPFSHYIIIFGEPMEIPRKASKEEYETLRQEFENRMNALQLEVDEACNQPSPEPAPVKSETAS